MHPISHTQTGTPAAHEPSQTGRSLLHAIGAGCDHMRVGGLSEDTIKQYREEAKRVRAWLREELVREPLLSDLTVENVDQFLLAAAADAKWPWARDTMEHYCGNLQAFAGHIGVACSLGTNPLAGLNSGSKRSTRTGPREGDGLDDADIVAVLDKLDPNRLYDVVTAAIFALGCEGGPRTSELIAIDVEDFQTVWAKGRELGPVIQILHPAKAGKPRMIPLGAMAEHFIRKAIGNRTSGPLFPKLNGERMSVSGCRGRLARAGGRAGIKLCPQRLRRSASSWQQTYRASDAQVNAVFGWKPDPRDVAAGHYTPPSPVQFLYGHQKYFSPLDNAEARLRAEGRSLAA